MLQLKSALFKFELILNILRKFYITPDPFLSHLSVSILLNLLLMLCLTAKFGLPIFIYVYVCIYIHIHIHTYILEAVAGTIENTENFLVSTSIQISGITFNS